MTFALIGLSLPFTNGPIAAQTTVLRGLCGAGAQKAPAALKYVGIVLLERRLQHSPSYIRAGMWPYRALFYVPWRANLDLT